MGRERFHWAWVILGTCFVNLFVNYGIRLGYGVVLPEMIRALGITRTQGGMIFNCYLLVYIILSPFTGNLTDRIGARRVITFFCILLGIGTFLMGTVHRFWAACLFYAIVGAGASAMWTPVVTVVQRWYGIKRRGMALGILSIGYGLGFATVGWLFPYIVESLSWRSYWYGMGSAALVMVLINALLLRSTPEEMGMRPWGEAPGTKRPKISSRGSIRYTRIVMTPRFWTIGISYLFISCALYIVTTYMVDYAYLELGIPYEKASLLATVHGLSQVLGVLTIPAISDYIGRRLTLTISNTVLACAILGIIAVGSDLVWLCTVIGIFGVFYGITWPLYGACAGDYFPKEVMGTVIGAWTPLYGLGAIMGNLLAGRMRDVTQSFHGALIVGVACACLAAILLGMLRRPRVEDRSSLKQLLK